MEHPPWRRGSAVLFPSPVSHGKIPLLRKKRVMFLPVFQWGAVALGWWRKRPNLSIEEDLVDEQWLEPDWMDEVELAEIRNWHRGDDECAPPSLADSTS